jgi:hypothetical protein
MQIWIAGQAEERQLPVMLTDQTSFLFARLFVRISF